MSGLQVTMIVLCFTIPLAGWALLFRQIFRYVRIFRAGAPDPTRTDRPATRTWTMLREVLGHTRMSRLPIVAIAHWFTMVSFGLLFLTLVNAFFQLIWADFALPIIGHFPPYEWATELFAWGGLIGIVWLMIVRQMKHPRSAEGKLGRRSRFFGSTFWQAYYVELTILGVVVCVLTLRTLEYQLALKTGASNASLLHFPLTAWMSGVWSGLSAEWVAESIYVVAAIKIMISFAWMITIGLQPTMGVAWHRFLAFFNIWFKRNADGRTALGALQPIVVGGTPLTAENLEEVMEASDESDSDSGEGIRMGVGKVEDFTWKGLLDFTTCTECGRCQSQCPAWNTDKPLSPKMLVMTLRDHAHAKVPYLLGTEEERAALPAHTRHLTEMPLIGTLDYKADFPLTAYDALGPQAVMDEDVLWSCTTCGACVEQCPVDIEHVDAILDMRRHQVLIESSFPSEFGSLFKNMESKGNPWGMSPKARMDWAKGLDFDIPVVGQDVEDLSSVDYLFWVGCAGALEDRAKKTTRAVAELLDTAGVSFAVLGDGESCTGDSARRAGNEILFQMLAAQNVEILNEAGAKKIVVTCAHCFNTIKNEYPQVGGNYEVVHHTQLLNRLVREKRLTPVARPAATPVSSTSKDPASSASTVTYHDPCYLGRHNNVYSPPRELIGALPGVELREMPRHGMTSFCCGAGGARMWAEEKLGTRVNINRTEEAVATGADRIAVGCPFCRVMLTDGLTAAQSEGTAREEVEVVDIAQMLLAAVRRGEEPAVEIDGADAGAGSAAAIAAGTAVTAPPASAPASAPAGEHSEPLETLQQETAESPAEADVAPDKAADAAAAPAGSAAPAAPPVESAEEAPAAPVAAPKGTMSAAEALAAMGAAPAPAPAEAPAEASAAPAPAEVAAATPAPVEETAPAAAEATPAEAPAPAEPAAPATPATAAPAASVSPRGKIEIPTGKMTATEALALLGGVAAAPAASAPAEAPTPTAAEAPTPASSEAPTSAPAEALAPAPTEAAAPAEAAPATPTAPAPAQAEAAAPVSPAAEAAPAALASPRGKVEIPTGKMTATEALALLGAAAAPAASAPAEAPAPAPSETPAPAEPVAPADASAAAAPAAPTESKAAEPSAPAAVAPAAAPAAPAPSTAQPDGVAQASIPTGRMTATEALAALSGASATAPADSPAAEQAPAPAVAEATPVVAERTAEPSPVTPGPAPTEPAQTEPAQSEPATTEATPSAPAAPPASAPPAAAPAPVQAAAPAPKAPAAPLPSGRMTATEALAAFAELGGSAVGTSEAQLTEPTTSAAPVTEQPATTPAPAPAPAEAQPATPAPAPAPVEAQREAPAAAPAPAPVEASVPAEAPAPAPVEASVPAEAPAPTETPAQPSAPTEAPAQREAPKAEPAAPVTESVTAPASAPVTPGAWQKVLDTADGKPMAASEVQRILSEG